MIIGPQYKIARRLGARIFPKTQTAKFTISGTERKTKGGKAGGGKGRRGMSEYGTQLIEKQKARYTYGVMEKQFRNYVKKAQDNRSGPSASLYKMLEMRLDNIVFRLGLVPSRRFARQAVSHGHILVNGRRVTIPSYAAKVGDVVTVREQSKGNGIFRELAERTKTYELPTWLSFDGGKMEGVVKVDPVLGTTEGNLNFSSILEFYSRV